MMNSNDERQAVQAAQPKRERGNHQGRVLRYEGTRMACPHCKCQSEIKTGRVVSYSMRELIYSCTNVECGFNFVAMTEIVRALNVSATPDPSVNIPLSTHVRRDMVRVLLDNAAESPHETRFTTPVTGDLFASGDTS